MNIDFNDTFKVVIVLEGECHIENSEQALDLKKVICYLFLQIHRQLILAVMLK